MTTTPTRLTLAASAALLTLTGCTYTPPQPPAPAPTPTPVAPGETRPVLDVATSTDNGTYDRNRFGNGWGDLDHDGCKTRDEILARDLTNVVTDDGCDVKAGTLNDPYTRQRIDFTDDRYWTVDVDHIYPLAHAWRMGAEDWTDTQRVAFSNDPSNLLAVQASANRQKGDSGPGEWTPINRAYACTYGRKYATVADRYDLPVTVEDLDSIDALLDTCPTAPGKVT